MAKDSNIGWTHHTFNPWWGCMKVSPGCANCYALTFSKRVGYDIWGPSATTTRRLFGTAHWNEPLKWNEAAKRAGAQHRVFCASMADVFEDHPFVESERAKLWSLLERTNSLDWLLLTKRPENVGRMTPWRHNPEGLIWPTVWLGTSVEDQERAEERIPALVDPNHPVGVLFLSCEPLLGPLDLTPWLGRIGWVIVGGESGPGHRPMRTEWVRAIRDQCQAAGVPLYYKQGGGLYPGKDRVLDGRTHDEFPTPALAGVA